MLLMLATLVVAVLVVVSMSLTRDAARMQEPRPDEKTVAEVGRPAPDFVLEKLGGTVQSLSSLRGRPVLLVFWTSWCSSCRDELSTVDDLGRTFAEEGLAVLAIHRTRTELEETAEQFMKGMDSSSIVLLDRTDEVYRTFVKGGRDLPASVLIDQDGLVRDIVFGGLDAENMDQRIRTLVQ